MSESISDRIRHALLEALGLRARFTRRHRGAFAAPCAGQSNDSSSMPAAWHAGDRVEFAWHKDGEVSVARFNPAGEQVLAPFTVGRGRWPRIAARGATTAIGWQSDDGSVIRTAEGGRWNDEIPIAGSDIAIAFAPGGALYAATNAGVWRLTGRNVEQIDTQPLAQPALAVTREGPVIASQKDGHIVCAGVDLGAGERPSAMIDDDGALHLTHRSPGGIALRTRKGDTWTPATVVAVEGTWPTLALGAGDELRLTYVAPASYGPDALWLVRLPEPNAILVPSLAGNVNAAWLTVDFGLLYDRTSYSAHDLLLTLNDEQVKLFTNTLPTGRHLFRLNPFTIKTSPGRPIKNSLAIRSWHMNRGHYRIASDFRLTVRTPWRERWAFATSEEEVASAPESLMVNHGRPDLAILANDLSLPVEPPEGELVNLDLIVANVGEAAAPACALDMVDGEEVLAAVPVPAIAVDGQWAVKIPLRHQGHTSVVVRLRQNTPDFDSSNDSMTIMLWRSRSKATRSDDVSRGEAVLPGMKPVTDFTLPSATSDSVMHLFDHGGKVILINWWRTTCGWSQNESARLVGLWNRYRDAGLHILGVSDDTAATVAKIPEYLRSYGIAWPVALNDQGEFMREIVVEGSQDTPGNYLVTRRGEFAYVGLDHSDADTEKLEQAIVRALAEPLPPGPPFERRDPEPAPPLAALQQFAGQPLIVNFFTLQTFDWAGKVLIDIQREFASRDLRVLGVNLFDGEGEVQRLVEQQGIPFPVVSGDADAQRNWIGDQRAWATFFLNRQHRVVKSILNSIENGLEPVVFRKYAIHLLGLG